MYHYFKVVCKLITNENSLQIVTVIGQFLPEISNCKFQQFNSHNKLELWLECNLRVSIILIYGPLYNYQYIFAILFYFIYSDRDLVLVYSYSREHSPAFMLGECELG